VEASVILRRHCTAVKHFNELWWHEVHTGSRRDQLSFNYAARKANLRIAYFPGTIRKPNDIFIKRHHRRKSDRFWKNAPLA
jgi:predicted neuraminidase